MRNGQRRVGRFGNVDGKVLFSELDVNLEYSCYQEKRACYVRDQTIELLGGLAKKFRGAKFYTVKEESIFDKTFNKTVTKIVKTPIDQVRTKNTHYTE